MSCGSPTAIPDSWWVYNVDCHYKTNDLSELPPKVRQFVEEKREWCQPANIHVCDGSNEENDSIIDHLLKLKMIVRLPKHEGCYLSRTDPADVARVESKTVISTPREEETIPRPKKGVKGTLGNWMSPDELDKALNQRFPGCMKGRTMFVMPFSMGAVGGPLTKYGIQITDSPYVVASVRIMCRMGKEVLDFIAKSGTDYVRAMHSVGQPLPMKTPPKNFWPCNSEKCIISHKPYSNEIISFGSGYGGNSLLGKKCLALRLGSVLGYKEGWFAEHMLILGITNEKGEKKYIVAAFPSACGKTNLAMITPTLPGWKAECVGDDICWMRFDEKGILHAINPESGFFGVCPGTSMKTNPIAMETVQKNTIFTNVGETSDGGFWWEGMPNPPDGITVKSWLNEPWTPGCGKTASHANARFCTPVKQCPMLDPAYDNPKGVPISAIIFGGRRPEGVPLVFECLNWNHGVFVAASMKSESTAAAEHKGKVVMHDPFGMRPFFGYNFCNYIRHWLSFGKKPGLKLPPIYHVNWFRKGPKGFLWPGFGENTRVLDWIMRRLAGEDVAIETPIGWIPKEGAINLKGLKEEVDMKELFALKKDFWLEEVKSVREYFDNQLSDGTPEEMLQELQQLKERVEQHL